MKPHKVGVNCIYIHGSKTHQIDRSAFFSFQATTPLPPSKSRLIRRFHHFGALTLVLLFEAHKLCTL